MAKTTPFLLFDGYCAEAMTFYQKCFGGNLTLIKAGDTPMKDQIPIQQHDKITYANLENGDIDISATDWLHPTRRPKVGNTVAIYIKGKTLKELKEIFDKLSEDADKESLDKLQSMPFGIYGHLADKYGVHWFFRGEN